MKNIFIILLSFTIWSCDVKHELYKSPLDSGTDALLQAISIIDQDVVWVSGHNATLLRTVDGGESWEKFPYNLADTLQFRDVHGFGSQNAVVMSAGSGKMSQIFRFNIYSGFQKTYQMEDSLGFLNTIEFWDLENGLAFGDSFNGQLFVLKTEDGGKTWQRIDPKHLPEAGDGEGGFAASGTCIATQPKGKAWIGTGAGGNSRVLFTEDFGAHWEEFEVPMIKGTMAGITSIRMLDEQIGSIVGGDLSITNDYTFNIAFTSDGGKTWVPTKHPITKGAFYGSDLTYLMDDRLVTNKTLWVACGPNGIDYSFDLGQTYTNLDTANYWAVDLNIEGFGYAVGTAGKILKLSF